jgi:CheY-like chemotaxis protein
MRELAERILVVDDSDDVLEWAKLVLETAEYLVTVASNGEEAFRRIREDRPNLVLLDVVMPGMDGLELPTQASRAT